ncbi:Ornithine decarboxylase-like protein [Hapsidospora chrysogenum ATCC 11550]|uniref:Ornithine decarboxylase n=1 Tax=Hapsidospora chrysogenum (strain ATCC 11550 / CBS 779.69 / DSM 880 / IAM 14645 / JCM 23072 / IMI 49137) TaxID=857340 RepID=A0A086T2R7_HAPC1|nr:Ornithine decarboxylase-like protein [Hapsidospora chrysogenum ATCC 11550]
MKQPHTHFVEPFLHEKVYNHGHAAATIDPKKVIGEALHRRVGAIDHEMCDPGDEDTFYVADLGDVYRQHLRWKKNLPRIRPFYAVKCNPDPKVLKLLAELGTGFDCASKTEIEQVLSMGASPDRIIYAQPCKTNSYVRFVKSMGVKQMTFDNADELYKIAKLFPGAKLFLRIMTDDTSSLCRLSMKFGAAMDTTEGLLSLARDLGLNVVGVSFHVGSGASDPMAFWKAVRDAHIVFQQARERGFSMRTLDVGGGFTGDTFEDMAAVLDGALDEFFPTGCGVDVIAEPGRYYVSSAFTIACNVIARRTVEDPTLDGKGYMVYVNDGVYGNFSSIMFDHQNPVPKILRCGGETMYNKPGARPVPAGEGVEYSIWGPTCDGIDRIAESVRFDPVLDVGDWLYFEDMGAYTKCSATQFNGFSNSHDVIYVCSEPGARALIDL